MQVPAHEEWVLDVQPMRPSAGQDLEGLLLHMVPAAKTDRSDLMAPAESGLVEGKESDEQLGRGQLASETPAGSLDLRVVRAPTLYTYMYTYM